MIPPPPRSTLFPYTTLFRSFSASALAKLWSVNIELSTIYSSDQWSGYLTNSVDGMALMHSLNPTDASMELDLLSAASGAGLPLMQPRVDRSASDLTQILAVFNSPIKSLPGGDVTAEWGVEWRLEGGRYVDQMQSVDRRMFGGFSQLQVPIVSEEMQLFGIY